MISSGMEMEGWLDRMTTIAIASFFKGFVRLSNERVCQMFFD